MNSSINIMPKNSWTPAPVAVCIVILRDGAVLAISRKDNIVSYGLPGGKIESGESPEAAAIRELEEETGFLIQEGTLTHIYDGKADDSGKIVRTYLANDPGGEPLQKGEGLVIWAGWPMLLTRPYGKYNAAMRSALLELPEQWVLQHGSGTLRRAIEEHLAWHELYLHERTAFEFGYGFEPAIKSRLTTGKPLALENDPATTETCWWARALRWRTERDSRPAQINVVHARLDDRDRNIREGIAIIYEPRVHPSWLPPNRSLIAFTTENNRTVNPC